jgi:hypothetical protein
MNDKNLAGRELTSVRFSFLTDYKGIVSGTNTFSPLRASVIKCAEL